MATEIRQIVDKLNEIQSDINYLKETIVDADVVLFDDDIQALKNAEKDLKSGKTRKL